MAEDNDRIDLTGWIVGGIIATALLVMAYLIFSANVEGPLPKAVTSPAQRSFMTECLTNNTYDTCEFRWEKLETASARIPE